MRAIGLLAVVLTASLLQGTFCFSSGGGEAGREGSPALQSCDAISVCASGTCPAGMTLVAPPERSDVYELRTGKGSTGTDPLSYIPGELMPMYIRVTKQFICALAFPLVFRFRFWLQGQYCTPYHPKAQSQRTVA
jgi:hypothetical protein